MPSPHTTDSAGQRCIVSHHRGNVYIIGGMYTFPRYVDVSRAETCQKFAPRVLVIIAIISMAVLLACMR
jgi:hypothetical protein